MTLFNEKIKKLYLVEILLVFIISYGVIFALNFVNISINAEWCYVVLILYFVFKLRNSWQDFKHDVLNIFSDVPFVYILGIVILNIFFSYGMLYVSRDVSGMLNLNSTSLWGWIPVMSLNLVVLGNFASIIFISPIVEELVFRGLFLNKLKILIPTAFAIIMTSMLFACLHSFGNIFSAFIFGICMSILYLKSENVLVPIFAHFLNNIISESIYYADYSGILFSNDWVMTLMSILAVVSFVLIVRFIISNLNKFK